MRLLLGAMALLAAGVACGILFRAPWLILGAGILVGLMFVGSSLHRVPEGHVVVIERLGRFVRVSGPGLVWIAPGLERVAGTVRVRIRTEQFVVDDILSFERLPLVFSAMVVYGLDFGVAERLRREIVYFGPQQWRELVRTHLEALLRDAVREYSVTQIIGAGQSSWQDIQAALKQGLGSSLKDWGIVLDDQQGVVLTNVQLPAQLREALETAVTAGIDSSTSINVLENILSRYPSLPQQVLLELLSAVRGVSGPQTVIVPTDFGPMAPANKTVDQLPEPARPRPLPDSQSSTGITIVRNIPARPDDSDDKPEGS